MDDYLAALPADARAALQRVRGQVTRLAPGAEEGRSYGVPAFIQGGKPLLGFAAAKKHLSIFPFSAAAVDAVRGRLDGYDLAKGTIRFTPDRPVPDGVVAELVRIRLAEIATRG